MTEYYTISEIAQKWNVSVRRVQMLCSAGKIEGVTKFGKSWAIPKDAKKPDDHRCLRFRTYSDNCGFSLVELIVVIAIMAVLVGVLVPSLLRHLEKSKEGVDSANIRSLYNEIQAEMHLTEGSEDIETAKIILKQGMDDWQFSSFQSAVFGLTDEHDEKPFAGGTAWIEYASATGKTVLRFGGKEDAGVNWAALKGAGNMARAFQLSGRTTIYGGDMSGFNDDEKALIQELKKRMNWGDGITIHVGNVDEREGTVQISCVNEDLKGSDYSNVNSWGKQTIATRITFNFRTGEIVKVVEQGGKWGNNSGTQGFWSNKEAEVIYSK